MTIEIANAHIDIEIENATDKRVKSALENIKSAANALYRKKNEINTTEIAEYIEKHFSKPKKQTLFNDSKGVYLPCINEFERLNHSIKNKKNERTKIEKLMSKGGVSKPAAIEIGNLTKRVKLLENILDVQFGIRKNTGLISVDKLVLSKPDENDSVVMSRVKNDITDKQKEAVQILMNTFLEECERFEIIGKGNSQRLINKETGESLLNPTMLASLNALLAE